MEKTKVWLSSDTHYHHQNIIKYCKRPFADVEEMNEALIENWNSVVGKNDLVYHLGDIAMGGKKKAEQTAEILSHLNGTIRLIKGNHDTYVLGSPCRERFEWVKDYYELHYDHKLIVLQHFPLLTWNMAGKVDGQGRPSAFHLHGHSHGGLDALNALTTRMDVGVDSQSYKPIALDQVIEIMNQRTYQSVDHHGSQTNYY